MIELHQNLSKKTADEYGIVLSSAGIFYTLISSGNNRWNILVDRKNSAKAYELICTYLSENKADSPAHEDNFIPDRLISVSGYSVPVALVVFHMGISLRDGLDIFSKIYGSSAHLILEGEIYRSVTSLLIHADVGHLVGNMLAISILGSAVTSLSGWGLGWLMILMSGISGNLANAVFIRSNHISIGASTAVFGAIGILCAIRIARIFRFTEKKITPIIYYLGAGLALLGFLGTASHTDITAHLFGFISGLFIGSVYGVMTSRPPDKVFQAVSLLTALSIIFASFIAGLFT